MWIHFNKHGMKKLSNLAIGLVGSLVLWGLSVKCAELEHIAPSNSTIEAAYGITFALLLAASVFAFISSFMAFFINNK